jgi:hypothetical protein
MGRGIKYIRKTSGLVQNSRRIKIRMSNLSDNTTSSALEIDEDKCSRWSRKKKC